MEEVLFGDPLQWKCLKEDECRYRSDGTNKQTKQSTIINSSLQS
jgi:hypothetical protein